MLDTGPKKATASELVVAGEVRRVLLVDDDTHVSRALSRVLRRFCEVEIASSVEEAERRIEKGESFALILCDLMLPDRTGVDLYRGLLEKRSPLARRIAFMTGLGEDAPEVEAFREVPCLGKPLDITRVRAILDAFRER